MEYMNVNEIGKEVKISIDEIMPYIKNGYFKDIKKDKSKSYFISKEDVVKFKDDIDFIRESYTIKEVADILFCSEDAVRIIIKKVFFSNVRTILRRVYICKYSIDEFVKKNTYLALLKTGMYEKVDEHFYDKYSILKEYRYKFFGLLNNDEFAFKHPYSRMFYLHSDERDKIINQFKILEAYYSTKDICSLFKCTYPVLLNYMTRILDVMQKHIIYNNHHFFEKEEVNSFLEEVHLETEFKKPIDYFNKVKNKTAKKYELKDTIMFDNRQYCNPQKASMLLNISVEAMIHSIKRGKFKNIVKKGSRYWIQLDEVIDIKDFCDNSIEIRKIDKLIISDNQIDRLIINAKVRTSFPNAVLFDTFNLKTWRVPYCDIEYYKANIIPKIDKAKQLSLESDPHILYRLLTEGCHHTSFKQTLNLYNEYSTEKMNDTKVKTIRNYVYQLVNCITKLLSLIEKDILLYNDEELLELIKSPILNSSNKLYAGMFFNYCLETRSRDCRFRNKYNKYTAYNSDESGSKIYSVEKWMDYFYYLVDIDSHIHKAFNSAYYSKVWLYTILHLSITWRRGDILSIPSLNIDGIENYDIDWFRNNIFTMTDAQKIINDVKTLLSSTKVHKTGAKVKAHFIICPILIIPTSIAIIIAEYHRKENKEDAIFGMTIPYKTAFTNFFTDEHLKDFSNTKANRTLITHNFNYAVQSDGMADIAYTLSTYLRSHMIDSTYGITDTTAQYIYATNSDGDASNVAFNLFKREWGWLYRTLICLSSDTSELTIEEMTKSIVMMKNEFPAQGIENFSNYLENEYTERKGMIKELIALPKESIKRILFDLQNGDLPSKVNSIQCIRYDGNVLKCPYPTNVGCIGCKYKIPTNYALSIIKVELYQLMNRLQITENEDFIMRVKYTHLIVKMLVLLREAKVEFDKWDNHYLESFMDLRDIEEKISSLKKTKFLKLK